MPKAANTEHNCIPLAKTCEMSSGGEGYVAFRFHVRRGVIEVAVNDVLASRIRDTLNEYVVDKPIH